MPPKSPKFPPGRQYLELGPVSRVDGQGCGDDGKRGNRDVQVQALRELQTLCDAGTITQPEFEKLKADMIR